MAELKSRTVILNEPFNDIIIHHRLDSVWQEEVRIKNESKKSSTTKNDYSVASFLEAFQSQDLSQSNRHA